MIPPVRERALPNHPVTPRTQSAFTRTTRTEWLAQMKTKTSVAIAAGIELTLLDCARFFHKAGGISQVAQVARDLGAKALARSRRKRR